MTGATGIQSAKQQALGPVASQRWVFATRGRFHSISAWEHFSAVSDLYYISHSGVTEISRTLIREIVHVLQMLNADWLLGEVAPFLLRQTHQEVFQDKRDLLVSIKSLKLGLNALLSLFVCSLQG